MQHVGLVKNCIKSNMCINKCVLNLLLWISHVHRCIFKHQTLSLCTFLQFEDPRTFHLKVWWQTPDTKRFKFPKFYSFLLNIQLSYNHQVGIKTSRFIHKKTQRHRAKKRNIVLNVFQRTFYKEEMSSPNVRGSRESCQQLKHMPYNKYIHCYEKSHLWQHSLVLKCFGDRIRV